MANKACLETETRCLRITHHQTRLLAKLPYTHARRHWQRMSRQAKALLSVAAESSRDGGRVAATSTIEQLTQLRPDVEAAITKTLDLGICLTESMLQIGDCARGKVRDTYDMGKVLVIVTTDRQSAFDRLIGTIPYKGQVLNETSAWWMHKTAHIAPNALLAVPDPNASIMLKCSPIAVEFVVRGYMTGSTETSLWTLYKSGGREFGGSKLPDGMQKNERLQANIITPTTKSADHDEPVSPHQIIERKLMTQEEWAQVSKMALDLFEFGQAEAAERGLILVDTKYEFGKTADGNIILIDEIHTPDSSRYWFANSYEARHADGKEPQSVDKEFLRLWFRGNCDPYGDKMLPEAPAEMVTELARRYITLYEKITGQQFHPRPPANGQDVTDQIASNVLAALEAL